MTWMPRIQRGCTTESFWRTAIMKPLQCFSSSLQNPNLWRFYQLYPGTKHQHTKHSSALFLKAVSSQQTPATRLGLNSHFLWHPKPRLEIGCNTLRTASSAPERRVLCSGGVWDVGRPLHFILCALPGSVFHIPTQLMYYRAKDFRLLWQPGFGWLFAWALLNDLWGKDSHSVSDICLPLHPHNCSA